MGSESSYLLLFSGLWCTRNCGSLWMWARLSKDFNRRKKLKGKRKTLLASGNFTEKFRPTLKHRALQNEPQGTSSVHSLEEAVYMLSSQANHSLGSMRNINYANSCVFGFCVYLGFCFGFCCCCFSLLCFFCLFCFKAHLSSLRTEELWGSPVSVAFRNHFSVTLTWRGIADYRSWLTLGNSGPGQCHLLMGTSTGSLVYCPRVLNSWSNFSKQIYFSQ